MLEKQFQIQFKRSVSMYCSDNGIDLYAYHKYPDTGIWQTPYDCHVRLPGRFLAFELKVNRLKTKFNFKEMFKNRYHEIQNLKRDKAMGDEAWVVIAWKVCGTWKIFAVTPGQADHYYRNGSIDAEDMTCIELNRKRNDFTNELLFDLTPLMNGFQKKEDNPDS